MGDADHDMINSEKAEKMFIERMPEIEEMMKKTYFDKMTPEQHRDVYLYYSHQMDKEIYDSTKTIEKKYQDIREKHWMEYAKSL